MKQFVRLFLPLLPAFLAVWLLLETAIPENQGDAPPVQLTELCAKNLTGVTDGSGRHGDWVELTNRSGADIDLSGWHLSDSKKDPARYTFPEGFVLPGEGNTIALLWADGQNRADGQDGLHLSFALDAGGGTVYLSDPEGNLVDSLTYPEQQWDITFGRRTGSSRETGFFASPTPAAANPSRFLEQWDSGALDTRVDFSVPAGWYEQPFALALAAGEDCLVFYTTDGSDPRENGEPFSASFTVQDRSGLPNQYVNQHCLNNISPVWQNYAVQPVDKCTVVKARAYRDGQWGPLCTATYWVGRQGHTLPVVSVSAAPEELFGSEGIYPSGSTYATARKYRLDMEFPGNNTSGVDIDATVELFAPDGTRTLADTARIHVSGEGSRSLTLQKSLNVDLDSAACTINGRQLDEFTLRGPGCGGTYLASYQDGFLGNYLAEHSATELGAQASVPVILYLEGEYWGIYMIREKKDGGLLESRYGVDGDQVQWLDAGSAEAGAVGAELTAAIQALDVNDPEDLAWVEQTFDMDNILSFIICNLFTNNFDGALVPNHNVILWRTTYLDEDNPYADGRWRALINDLDVTFADPENRQVPEQNRLQNLIEDGNTYDSSFTMLPKLLVHTLWGNEDFRLDFVRRCVQEMQTTYQAETLAGDLRQWRDTLRPEMEQNLRRLSAEPSEWAWLYPLLYEEEESLEFSLGLDDWDSIMDAMLLYVQQRGERLTEDLWTWCAPEMERLAQQEESRE